MIHEKFIVYSGMLILVAILIMIGWIGCTPSVIKNEWKESEYCIGYQITDDIQMSDIDIRLSLTNTFNYEYRNIINKSIELIPHQKDSEAFNFTVNTTLNGDSRLDDYYFPCVIKTQVLFFKK